jgi:hypothetical protein
MSAENHEALARKFLSILGRPDADIVKTVAVEEITWYFREQARSGRGARSRGDHAPRADERLPRRQGRVRPGDSWLAIAPRSLRFPIGTIGKRRSGIVTFE